jgi:hypothetical protein
MNEVPLYTRVSAFLLVSFEKRPPVREIGNLLPNNRRQRRKCYALCHILYPVSAAHTSIFRMDSNSTARHLFNTGEPLLQENVPPRTLPQAYA